MEICFLKISMSKKKKEFSQTNIKKIFEKIELHSYDNENNTIH
jgi:hypothetical protein